MDLSLDLQGLAKSGLMALLAGARHRLGCTGLKEFSDLISRAVPEGEGLHAVDRNLKVAEFLGCPPGPPDFRLGPSAGGREPGPIEFLRGPRGVRNGEKIIGLQVGASLPQKCWPLEIGAPCWSACSLERRSRWSCWAIRAISGFGGAVSDSRPGVIDGLGRLSLRHLAAVMERCRLVVGSDTGPLHLAVALGVPVVGLYGPDDPRFTGPYGAGNRVHYKKLPCSPCYKKPTCQGRFDCLQAIAAAEVFESLRELLAADDRRGEAF